MAITRLSGANAISGVIPTSVGGTGSTASTLPASLINNTSIGNITALPAGVGGSMVLLQTTDASNVASVTVGTSSLINATYKNYIILCSNIIPTSDGAVLYGRYSIGGAIQTASNYRRCRIRMYDGSTAVTGYTDTAQSLMNSLAESAGNASGENFNCELILFNPSSTTNYKFTLFRSAGFDLTPNTQLNTSEYTFTGSLGAVDGIQFFFSSGNISSGTFKLYGIG